MQTTIRSTLIVGATALFAVFGAAQAAEPYSGGINSLRSYLNENVKDFSLANGSGQYGDDVTSIRRLMKGLIKDVGARRAEKK
jgi:hypothetical protein